MDHRGKLISIIKPYARKIPVEAYVFYVGDDITNDMIDNASKHYAKGVDKSSVIALVDTSILNNGKSGFVFTDTKVYYKQIFEKAKKLWYDEVKSVKISRAQKADNESEIEFHMKDGTYEVWFDGALNKRPLLNVIKKLIKYINDSPAMGDSSIPLNEFRNEGAYAGGYAAGTYKQVNKLYGEEKFHASQGHGYAAERANHQHDVLTGHKAKLLGDNNVLNGPDRSVDGIMIQSKYYKTGSECVNSCFDKDGNFRYMQGNGKPMQIEVPSDKYSMAVKTMENKIRQGKIPGITDPDEAKNIVRKGHVTYEQAKNIAKAGNIDSVTYDAKSGAVIAMSALGMTAMITFATNVWNGESYSDSLKMATYSGIKVGGTAFINTIIAGQLSKAGLNSALVGSSEAIVTFMGPKASAVLINAFRAGEKSIYGAAAMKSAAKLLRGNVITGGVTVVVISSVDVINIFRGRISVKQLFKNLANTTTTVAGGTGGLLGGAAIGSAIMPGVGTAIGGLLGSVAAGAAAGKVTNTVLDHFIEDDAEEMLQIIQTEFGKLANDYLLNKSEAEKVADQLSLILKPGLLKDMYASKSRNTFARNIIKPVIKSETKKRKHVSAISDDQITKSLKEILEDIAVGFTGEIKLA